jgi:hypothetical protein
MNDLWLQNLKVGDRVIEDLGFDGKFIARVRRLTKTQIIVNHNGFVKDYETKYRLADGFSVGGDIWSTHLIREATPEAIAAVEEEQYRRRFRNKISHLSWADVPLDKLKQIREIVDPYIRKEDKNV